ncbi:type IV secretory system conjugative DNA transfer family protein [Pantoea sp. Taur]|uniref:type IV secretory system conjugative DNA transfer family protein n=1 Tax=Pantoea sp. Taur TaxID=2576757 RepID=UPI001927D6EF
MKKHFFAGLFFAATVLPAGHAAAETFTRCHPNSMLWETMSDEQLKNIARLQETKRCQAVNDTYDQWQQNFQSMGDAENAIRSARARQNWNDVKLAFDKVSPQINELHRLAESNSSLMGAGNIQALFGGDLNYLFQNARLVAPASADGLTDSVSQMLTEPDKQSKAAGIAQQLVYQSRVRAQSFIEGIARNAGDQAEKPYRTQSDQIVEEKAKKFRGDSVEGYFGGILARISQVYAPVLLFLIIVAVMGVVTARRVRLDAFTASVKAVMAAVVPAIALAIALIFMPFLPSWVLYAAALAATFAIYSRSRQILGGLASRCRRFPALAAGLRWIGGFVSGIDADRKPESGAASATPAAHHTHGSSRWGTPAEMQENNHLLPKAKQTGFTLAREVSPPAGTDGKFCFTGHVVTIAPTGSGKGIGAVIPNLLTYQGSALVFDPKGENAEVTGRRRREMGQSVHVIDPFGVTSGVKESVNVLDRLNVASPDCVAESAVLAESLVVSEKGGDGNHFDESARTLLQGLMLHVSALPDASRRNLAELRRLITSDEENLLTVLADMASDEDIAFGIPARAANTLMGMADRERGSVLSTARKNTAFLDDPRVAAALSHSDFDLSAIKAEVMTVYLVLPANRIAANTRFVRLFIGSVISAVTESKAKPAHNVAFILDEFNVLGYMKSIEDAVSLLRGYGLSFWVFLQDLSQLKSTYPKWQTFLANSAKTFFGTDDYDTAKYVSDTLGKSTVEFETQNSGRNSGGGVSGGGGSVNRGRSSGSSQQFAGRELLTPDEVMRLGPTRPIVILKGEYPYQLKRINYLEDPEYAGMSDPNPYYGA